MPPIAVTDLAAVVYSAGKVFDGLQTGRLATEEFLRTGDTTGINSMHDLALLRDLRQAATTVIEHGPNPIDADFITQLNGSMTRSASIEPGALRRDNEQIGVGTIFGRHEPPAITREQLKRLVADAAAGEDDHRNAAQLFLAVAKAQPFKDGNKRTGIFAANALLLSQGSGSLLTVPFSEGDQSVAQRFNEKLARAYMFDEGEAVVEALVNDGIIESSHRAIRPGTEAESAKLIELKARIAQRVAYRQRAEALREHEDGDTVT